MDTPPLWTPHHCGHFLSGPFSFPYYRGMCPQYKVSTTVDGSLIWTLLARPLGVHIRGTLLYLQLTNFQSPIGIRIQQNIELKFHVPRLSCLCDITLITYYHILETMIIISGPSRRRSMTAVAMEIFETHHGTHILQVGLLHYSY